MENEYLYLKAMMPEANIPNKITDVSISLQHPEGHSSNNFPSPQNYKLQIRWLRVRKTMKN